MARYRRIDTRMYGDAKFRSLSSPPACGKYLLIFLLTGPHTTNLPGLFRAGEMALTEELGWPLEGFRKAFAELFREGLVKADWAARVVWIPNVIKYNPPANPNVVTSWRDSWDEVPECTLKVEAFQRLKEFTKGLGEGFGKAFREACAKGLANQEQEQELEQDQEQEQEKDKAPELKISSGSVSQHPRQKKIIKTSLPENFIISDAVKEWARTGNYGRLEEHLDYFVGYVKANGKTYADWDQAFKNAIRGNWAKVDTSVLTDEVRRQIDEETAREKAHAAVQVDYHLPSDIDLDAGEEIWRFTLKKLAQSINPHSFDTWLRPIKAAGLRDRTLYLVLPSNDFSHVREKFGSLLLELLPDLKLEFLIPKAMQAGVAAD